MTTLPTCVLEFKERKRPSPAIGDGIKVDDIQNRDLGEAGLEVGGLSRNARCLMHGSLPFSSILVGRHVMV